MPKAEIMDSPQPREAAMTKDAQYYDRCVEYMSMVQQGMQAAGVGVQNEPRE